MTQPDDDRDMDYYEDDLLYSDVPEPEVCTCTEPDAEWEPCPRHGGDASDQT